MLPNIFRNKIMLSLATLSAAVAFSGCSSLVYDDLSECPARLDVKFQFNYTLDRGEAFAAQVHSVNVWAFDKAGKFVWSGAASGEALTLPDFKIETTLGEGTYDFIAWCGLDGNDDFALDTYTPTSMRELEVKLNTIEKDGANYSSSHFSALFHGMKSGVEHKVDPYAPSITTVTIPLIKDTNDIAVMLVNQDGTVLDRNDFTVSVSYADSWLAWDNAVISGCPTVTYTPWSSMSGATTSDMIPGEAETPVRSTALYEMSVSRLIAGGDAWLNVVRNTDGELIIHVPLIDFFLLEKGARFDIYGDQEYLDRRSDYSVVFFLDNGLNWYIAAGIYINGWAIVPPQNEGM